MTIALTGLGIWLSSECLSSIQEAVGLISSMANKKEEEPGGLGGGKTTDIGEEGEREKGRGPGIVIIM